MTPQARPPHGPAVLITDVKNDDPVYKGTRIKEMPDPTRQDFRKHSCTYIALGHDA